MSLSKLARMCKSCPDRDMCGHKRMEALAEAELPKFQSGGVVMNDGNLFTTGSVSDELIGDVVIPSEEFLKLQKTLEEKIKEFCKPKNSSMSITQRW